MGKSSLMVRTAQALTEQTQERIRSVIVDLQELGTRVSEEQWYLGFLKKIAEQLSLAIDVVSWWEEREKYLGRPQRLAAFFEQVVLAEIEESVVIFIDEIDTTLRLDFTDDFFGVIRFLYLSRAQVSDFYRLSFVLIDVATPGELIQDLKRTPFNIGQQVDLTDFTYDEVLPFAMGFGLSKTNAEQVLKWILIWTGGHPYLTQRLCRVIAERTQEFWSEKDIDKVVRDTFLGAMSEQDNNLQFVRNMLVKESSDISALLTTYQEIYQEKKLVLDEEQSLVKSHLKLSGIVRRDGSFLRVRNLIYQEVFDRKWIREHLPVNWAKRLRKAVIAAGITFLILPTPLAIWAMVERGNAILASDEAERQRQIAEENASLARTEAQRAKDNEFRANQQAVFAEQERSKAEAARRAEAEQRTIAEQKQYEAEIARQSEAVQRQIAENQRSIAENERDKTGQARLEAEQQRVIAQLNLSKARLAAGRELEALLLALEANQLVRNLNLLGANSISFLNFNSANGSQKDLRRNLFESFLELSNLNEKNWLESTAKVTSNVIFNADKSFIVAGSADGKIRFWDRSGKALATLEFDQTQTQTQETQTQEVRRLGLSPDEKTLVAGSNLGQVRILNLENVLSHEDEDRRYPLSLPGVTDAITDISFSSNSQQIILSAGEQIWLLDQNSEVVPRQIGEMASSIEGAAISNDGNFIAAVDSKDGVQLWNLDGGAPITLAPQTDRSWSGKGLITFSPDDRLLAVGSGYSVNVLSLSGEDPISLSTSSYPKLLEFSSDSQMITIVSANGNIQTKTLEGDIELSQDLLYPSSLDINPNTMNPSSDGELLAVTQDNKVILWALPDLR
jgi:WD40 repeat protein